MVDRFRLDFACCIKINNELWFSPTNCSGIYRYNLNSRIAEQVSELLPYGEDVYYQRMCLYQHSLIFLPYHMNRISVFDMENGSMKQIELPCSKRNLSIYEDFGACVVYFDRLYVIGFAYPGIIKVDLKTYEADTVYSISKEPDNFKSGYFGNRVAVCENLLYIPCLYRNKVFICDMGQDIVSEIEVGKDSGQYSGIVNVGNDFYLLERNARYIIHWNQCNNICKEISLNFQNNFVAALMCASEEYVWVFSIVPGEIYQIECLRDNVRYIDLKQKFSISYAEAYRDNVFFLDSYTCSWYRIDGDGAVQDLGIQIEESKNVEEMWENVNATYLEEHNNFPIDYLFYQICGKDDNTDRDKTQKKLAGDEIWNQISRRHNCE